MITKFNTLERKESASMMSSWVQNEGKDLPTLNEDYQHIRENIEKLFNVAKKEMAGKKIDQYEFDVRFGVRFYSYVKNAQWFSMRLASDDGFWRYLAIVVAPHLVGQRWGYNNEDHYWKKGTRIWFRTLWWYSYLAWNKDIETTKAILLDPRYSTDTIMHLVERTSRKGTNVDLYRKFFEVYNSLPSKTIADLRKKVTRAGGVFGSMMCLNTTHTVVLEPTFYEGGLEGYARSLFIELGADI